MTTREVADYLRIKERKVYTLVREDRIPCTRVTGKWLFSKTLIDAWLAQNTGFPPAGDIASEPPPVIAGSHDPLLEWCLRESDCGLALLGGGSLDGLARLGGGEAMACGLHVFDREGGGYNLAAIDQALGGRHVVAVTWAWRLQGLIISPGNPHNIRSLEDLKKMGVRVAAREPQSGSALLFDHLLEQAGIGHDELDVLPDPARSETDIGLAVFEGSADAGLAIAAVAQQFKLGFIQLYRERYDLVVQRRDYFEPPFQKLLAFARSEAFAEKAGHMGGYDISHLGEVIFNAS